MLSICVRAALRRIGFCGENRPLPPRVRHICCMLAYIRECQHEMDNVCYSRTRAHASMHQRKKNQTNDPVPALLGNTHIYICRGVVFGTSLCVASEQKARGCAGVRTCVRCRAGMCVCVCACSRVRAAGRRAAQHNCAYDILFLMAARVRLNGMVRARWMDGLGCAGAGWFMRKISLV